MKTKYTKKPNYRLLIEYPDGTTWDVPAFTSFSIDKKEEASKLNYYWGSEEEWDNIPDDTEVFPPETTPNITSHSAHLEIVDLQNTKQNSTHMMFKQMFDIDLTPEETAFTAGWLAACRCYDYMCKTEASYDKYIQSMAKYFNKDGAQDLPQS